MSDLRDKFELNELAFVFINTIFIKFADFYFLFLLFMPEENYLYCTIWR